MDKKSLNNLEAIVRLNEIAYDNLDKESFDELIEFYPKFADIYTKITLELTVEKNSKFASQISTLKDRIKRIADDFEVHMDEFRKMGKSVIEGFMKHFVKLSLNEKLESRIKKLELKVKNISKSISKCKKIFDLNLVKNMHLNPAIREFNALKKDAKLNNYSSNELTKVEIDLTNIKRQYADAKNALSSSSAPAVIKNFSLKPHKCGKKNDPEPGSRTEGNKPRLSEQGFDKKSDRKIRNVYR